MPPSISDTWSDSPPLSSKVKFGPLSPKSSQTLRRHHEDTGEHERNADNALGPDAPKVDSDPPYPTTSSADMPMPAHDSQSQRTRERSDSDPSSNRQPALRRRRKRAEKRSDNPGHAQEEEVEELPDRFDSSGQPLEGSSRGSARGDSGWTSRRGEFEYRPRGGGSGDRNVHMQGSWGVAGTDGDAVNNIARSVGDVLEGRQGWMGLLGDVLGSFGGSGDALDGHDRSRGDHGIEDRDRDRNDHKQRRRRSSRRRDSDYDD